MIQLKKKTFLCHATFNWHGSLFLIFLRSNNMNIVVNTLSSHAYINYTGDCFDRYQFRKTRRQTGSRIKIKIV